ncbi:MAG: S24/S26 family peptidase [Acutalibacteraceae bacterium]|nr:S24/S26 family peptidase [Acutalibacteraceae bacterium]
MSKTFTYEEVLQKDGKLIYRNKGTSMLPLIRENRDLIIIEKKDVDRCKKYDIVLYKRKSGEYVLHRILKVRKEDYIIAGDHCTYKEYGITDNQILGVLTAVVRDGKTIKTTNKKYLLYTHLWCDFYYIRVTIIKIKSFCSKTFHKIFGKPA